MSGPATYEDANLLLKLYELRREEKLRQARGWFEKTFKVQSLEEAGKIAPPDSDENAYVRMVTSYWDMAATLLNTGILHKELFYQNGFEMLGCYARITPILAEVRQSFDNPLYLKNLEDACKEYIDYLERQKPGLYAQFEKFMRS